MLETLNIVGKSFEELMALFLCEVSDDDDFYDVLAYNLAKSHRRPFEAILSSLESKRLRAALCGLGLTESAQSDALLVNYLSHGDEHVVAAAIDALRRTCSIEWQKLSPYLTHQSGYVRGAALRFAKARLTPEQAKPLLLEALKDHDEVVRQSALDELDGVATRRELDLLRPLLNDPSDNVRLAAKTAVDAISR